VYTLHKFLLILPPNTHFLTAIKFAAVGNLYRTNSKSLGRLCVVVLALLLMADVERNRGPLNTEGRTCRIVIQHQSVISHHYAAPKCTLHVSLVSLYVLHHMTEKTYW